MSEPTQGGLRRVDPRSLWPSAVLSLGLLGAALYQRSVEGIQVELIALGVIALPAVLEPAVRPARGLRPSLPWLVALIALLGVEPRGVADWALQATTVGALISALAPTPTTRHPALRWGSLILVAAAALDHVALVAADRLFAWVRLVAFAPVVIAARHPTASWRRAGLCLALLGLDLLGWVRGGSGALALVVTVVAGGTSAWSLFAARVEPRRARRAAFPVIAIGISLAAVWLLGEAAFRLVPNRYANINVPEPGEAFHQPGETFTYRGARMGPKVGFEVEVTWNRYGFWDVDHALEKPPGTRRVVVLGDSYVEGVMVELDDLLHRRLERGLTQQTGERWEAISYGWSGFGQVQSLEAFLEGGEAPVEGGVPFPPAQAFDPDLVVLEFLPGNDVYDNLPALSQLTLEQYWSSTFARRYYLVALEQGLYFTAMLLDKTDLLLRQLAGEQDSIVLEVYEETPPRHAELWAAAWARTEGALTAFAAASREHDFRLVVVVFPSLGESTQPGFDYPARRVLALCDELGVERIDLTPHFAAHPDPAELFVEGDGHWGANGHAVASDVLLDYLRAQPRGAD